MDLMRFCQYVVLPFGLIGKVIVDSPQLHTLGPDGVNGVVIALYQLVPVQSMPLCPL